MNTEIIDILVEIVEGIHNKQSINRVLKNIKKTRKVNNNLIAAIYSWIFDKITKDIADRLDGDPAFSGVRLLSAEELEIIGIDNYNYLLHLFNMGLLNNSDLEKILDQAITFQEGELTMDEINFLILSIFLDSNSVLPPGSRFLLYSSDTIN
jgi:uncharacterized protein Smg (DUF494 family)